MKNLFSSFCFLFYLFCCFNASGQKIHLGDTSNRWITRNFVDEGQGNAYWNYNNFDYKDTVVNIDGHSYRYLQIENSSDFLIREDGNKVFLRALNAHYFFSTIFKDTVNEFLYFDYSLRVGDTLTLPITDSSEYTLMVSKHLIAGIDSLLINSTWHKVFSMSPISGFMGNYSFTEGIGTYWGPIIPNRYGTIEEPLPYLICFKNNNTTPLTTMIDCDHPTEINETNSSIKQYFHLYPNPANGAITIEYSGAENSKYSISILDLSGRTLLKMIFQVKRTLDISNFLSGMYIIQVADENGVLFRDKIVVE